MSGALAAILLCIAVAASAAIATRIALRTGLGPWHPAVAWLALETVFFGIGSIVLAVTESRTGPALFLAAALAAFSAGAAVSDRFAGTRAAAGRSEPAAPPHRRAGSPDDWRPSVAVGLAVVAAAALAPTIVRTGLPVLVGDITAARTEITGITLQLVRVFLPALGIGLALDAWRRPDMRPRVVATIVLAATAVFELALASRYLPAELFAALALAIGLSGRRMPFARLVAIGLVALLAFGAVQVFRAYGQAAGREIPFAIERTVSRVVMVQPRTLDALQVVIPAEEPFFGGLTWLHRLGPAIGRPDIPNLGYWIFPRLFPGGTATGYAAPGLIGEAWANFGPAGIALFALFGAFVERLGALIARRRDPDSIADLVTAALLILFVARTHALGLNGLALLAGAVALWRLVSGGQLGRLGESLRATVNWR